LCEAPEGPFRQLTPDPLTCSVELFKEPAAIIALSVHEAARAEAAAVGVTSFAYKGDPPARLLSVIRESTAAVPPRIDRGGDSPQEKACL
jgi:hypothetical protein